VKTWHQRIAWGVADYQQHWVIPTSSALVFLETEKYRDYLNIRFFPAFIEKRLLKFMSNKHHLLFLLFESLFFDWFPVCFFFRFLLRCVGLIISFMHCRGVVCDTSLFLGFGPGFLRSRGVDSPFGFSLGVRFFGWETTDGFCTLVKLDIEKCKYLLLGRFLSIISSWSFSLLASSFTLVILI